MSTPPWADEQLSNDLPLLRARGEGQELELMRKFPDQVSELAKEIAAFATSNTGTILLGVEDNGDLVGLEGMEDSVARDKLLQRLEGICSGSIKPAITPRAAWAVEGEYVVLSVIVPKGSEPVYYSQGKPYLRHITASRPAEPHEVLDIMRRYLGARVLAGQAEPREEDAFYSELASILHGVLLWTKTPSRERHVNPWLGEWRAEYSHAATQLRDLASGDIAVRQKLDERLREVATALDEVSNLRLTLGCGNELEAVATRASEAASALKRDTVDKIPLGEGAAAQIRAMLAQSSRKLGDLASRSHQMVEAGSMEELQSEVGSMGRELVLLSFYNLTGIGEGLSSELELIGMRMRLLEVKRIYMDGGASMREVVAEVEQCAADLRALADRLGAGAEPSG